MTGRPPRPQPPGPVFLLSRALARDNRLTPQEQVAQDSVPPPVRPQPAIPTPGELLVGYAPMLEAAGWETEYSDHPLRARLEAYHPTGAEVMITADLRRPPHAKRRHIYVLDAPGTGRWVRIPLIYLEYYARHRVLPPGAKASVFRRTKCTCDKSRYPTRRAARRALDEVRARVGRTERRLYRCEADDRVWHLTSKAEGYTDPIPLAGAYPPPGR